MNGVRRMWFLGSLGRRWSTVALVALQLVGCAAQSGAELVERSRERRYSRTELQKSLGPEEGRPAEARAQSALVIGEFKLHPSYAILDGDTVRVVGLDATLRLLAVDTEETFKQDRERRLFARGWDAYVRAVRGSSKRPVKMATPVGEEAKTWAIEFFAGSDTVRLERDHPGEIRDFYGRYLAYVFARKGDRWVNYNVEVVRAGYSPYFTKYGRSRRFHDDFVQAQAEAQAARRGIWDPARQHYPDYDERLAWWEARREAIDSFEAEADGRDDHVLLTRFDSIPAIEARLGEEVTVFALVGEVVEPRSEKAPTVVKLSKNRMERVQVVFFDRAVFERSEIARRIGEYVRIRGKVTRYRNQLQISVHRPSQVRTYPLMLDAPGTSADDDEDAIVDLDPNVEVDVELAPPPTAATGTDAAAMD